jgi:NADH dehydrogenase
VGYWVGTLLGKCMGDVMITREEIKGLMADLLCVNSPATGTTVLTEWARKHADQLGKQYTSELARRRDRTRGYASN